MRYYKFVLAFILVFTVLLGGKVYAESTEINLNIADDELLVIVDDEQVTFPDQKPFIDDNNRTLIPVRFPSEAFGADVDWVGEKQKVVIEQDDNGRIVKMWINNKEINVNGDPRQMDTAPVIENGRTMVPTRFVAEALGVDVDYRSIEGRGVVFNFTEDQSEEEKQEFMDRVEEEIEEKTAHDYNREVDASDVEETIEISGLGQDRDMIYIDRDNDLPVKIEEGLIVEDMYLDRENDKVVIETADGEFQRVTFQYLDENMGGLGGMATAEEVDGKLRSPYIYSPRHVRDIIGEENLEGEIDKIAYFGIDAPGGNRWSSPTLIVIENKDYWN